MKIIQRALLTLIAVVALLVPAVPVFAAGTAIPAPTTGEFNCTGDLQACTKKNPIVQWINFFVNTIAVIIFVGATAMMIFAGIQYMTAADNAQKIQDSKKRITNVIVGLIAFFFLYAFMQWLIPGGIF
jgi:fumarate reductase subunit C